VGVTGSREDLKDTVLDREERDVESSTSEVVDDNLRLGLAGAVKTVGDGGGSGLVDDTQDGETGNDTGVAGSRTLGVVEVYTSAKKVH